MYWTRFSAPCSVFHVPVKSVGTGAACGCGTGAGAGAGAASERAGAHLDVVKVLIAHAAGVSNDQTAFGASLFFYARVAHAVVYAFGWPWIRPLCWFVSFVGLAMIVSQLFIMA